MGEDEPEGKGFSAALNRRLQQDPQNAGGPARVNLVASAAPSIAPLLFLYCSSIVAVSSATPICTASIFAADNLID